MGTIQTAYRSTSTRWSRRWRLAAFFSNSPLRDDNFAVGGVKKAEAKARQVYALLGAADRLQIRYPDSAHDFPPEVRREAYEFIDRVLQHATVRGAFP